MDCIQSREKERVKVFVAVYVSYLANKPLSLSLSLGAFNNHNLQILGGATEQMRLYNAADCRHIAAVTSRIRLVYVGVTALLQCTV